MSKKAKKTGRKLLAPGEKKINVQVYLKERVVKKFGGRSVAREAIEFNLVESGSPLAEGL